MMRWHTKVAFASGHFLNVMSWALWFPYNVTFFTKVLQLPPNITGDIILTVQVVGAFFQPFMGMWSDQTNSKFGKRKIFQLLGMVAISASFFFLWHECITCGHASPRYQVLYFSSFGIVFVAGWAAITISQLSLVPELAPNKHAVVELNALRYSSCTVVNNYYVGVFIKTVIPFIHRNTFTYLASILVFSGFWILLETINHAGSTNNLTPSDKKIFWVRT